MSAFNVDVAHVAIIVGWYACHRDHVSEYGSDSFPIYGCNDDSVPRMTLQQMGQELLTTNAESVAHRYNDRPIPTAFKPATLGQLDGFTPLEIVKACNCLDYQSCELSDWKATRAYAILQMIRDKAISSLPGYSNARGWGLTANDYRTSNIVSLFDMCAKR